MQQILTDINFLYSSGENLLNSRNSYPDEIFSTETIEFLNSIARELNKLKELRSFPDLASLAFYCRKANLNHLRKQFEDGTIRLGRGVVFHIAPSNVPLNFAYSLIVGLLSGNINIVRLPSKDFEQVDLFCKVIQKVTEDERFSHFITRVILVKYDKTIDATKLLSSLCDVRVIWGGDTTIEQIRKYPIPSRSFDVTFADRYSFALLHADKIILETNLEQLANQFYNDTYLFDQNACSAPRIVIWSGNKESIVKAKEMFWGAIQERIKTYDLAPKLAVDKLMSLYLQSISSDDHIRKVAGENNKLWRVEVDQLFSHIDRYSCAGGYFIEYEADQISEIKKIVNRRYQTLAYYGFEKDVLSSMIRELRLQGVDRVVPIGKTTDFSHIWDGYDLVRTLSRECQII